MTRQIDVVIDRIERKSGDVVAIELVTPDGSPLPTFAAGSHIETYIRPQIVRPYSLCNDPGDAGRYRIGVLNDANSRGGSKIVCTQWVEGMQVRISEPRNLFPLAGGQGRSVLVGGGIGITPLMAMAHSLAAADSLFELHYCARDASRAPFLEELSNASFGLAVRSHFSTECRFDFSRDVGRAGEGDHLYVCGPQGFMDHVIAEAKRLGWTDGQIHFEYFDADTDVSGGPFRVQLLDGSEYEIPAGRSIADVLIEAGQDVEVSCEKGICGSCITNVLEGEPDHRDHYLTDDEKAANDCMALCCSRAFTPFLKLDL